MSELHTRARHVDPLDALRAADHRPVYVVWRERIYGRLAERFRGEPSRAGSLARSFLGYALAMGFAAALVWRLFAATAPPVEDSIPLAAAPPVDSSTPVNAEARPVASSPVVTTMDGQSIDAPQTVVVHVAGAVERPGLVSGFEGWRIDDVVRAAGGAMPNADLDRLNLAAVVHDGERIFVPIVGETEPSVINPTGGSGVTSAAGSSPSAPAVVDVNTADLTELQTLPGVGPATAATIISHREEYGNFADVDALIAVRGIGPATLETLRDHVRVG